MPPITQYWVIFYGAALQFYRTTPQRLIIYIAKILHNATTRYRVIFYCAAMQFYRAPRPLLRSGLFAALHNVLFYPALLYPLRRSAVNSRKLHKKNHRTRSWEDIDVVCDHFVNLFNILRCWTC
ncbi:hypothetical protein T4B_8931 [Trichinella pseudospiralis]|uniref:Uncharacterized protein n=1 Tax=Trichinella pseudospiralis TaxID=6337 RepID=A0A0V1IN92_TRIPS|nr:hypothetical protein T4B_14926 [Trichinella pseudospiralis]KRZ24315.1 hypothetical protein T4B_8931 [Trichinella pseudospiralis]KRZ41779.1 hypothetical protein T4C_10542 [Trichinella pseudospiralis]